MICKTCNLDKQTNEFSPHRHTCKECRKKSKRAYNEKHKVRLNKQWHERYLKVADLRRATQILRNRKLKLVVLSHYSNETLVCSCCGEKHLAFLSIDHINGRGTKHRKEVGSGLTFYLWLRRNNFPTGYRVLCHNCNFGRQVNKGVCPHEYERLQDIHSNKQGR